MSRRKPRPRSRILDEAGRIAKLTLCAIGHPAAAPSAGGFDPQSVARLEVAFSLAGEGFAVEHVPPGRAATPTVPPAGRMAATLADQRVAHRLQRVDLAHKAGGAVAAG